MAGEDSYCIRYVAGWQFTNPSLTSMKGSLAGTEFVESRYVLLIPEVVTRCTALFKTTYGAGWFYSVCGLVIETWGKLEGNLGEARQSVIPRTSIITAGMIQCAWFVL